MKLYTLLAVAALVVVVGVIVPAGQVDAAGWKKQSSSGQEPQPSNQPPPVLSPTQQTDEEQGNGVISHPSTSTTTTSSSSEEAAAPNDKESNRRPSKLNQFKQWSSKKIKNMGKKRQEKTETAEPEYKDGLEPDPVQVGVSESLSGVQSADMNAMSSFGTLHGVSWHGMHSEEVPQHPPSQSMLSSFTDMSGSTSSGPSKSPPKLNRQGTFSSFTSSKSQPSSTIMPPSDGKKEEPREKRQMNLLRSMSRLPKNTESSGPGRDACTKLLNSKYKGEWPRGKVTEPIFPAILATDGLDEVHMKCPIPVLTTTPQALKEAYFPLTQDLKPIENRMDCYTRALAVISNHVSELPEKRRKESFTVFRDSTFHFEKVLPYLDQIKNDEKDLESAHGKEAVASQKNEVSLPLEAQLYQEFIYGDCNVDDLKVLVESAPGGATALAALMSNELSLHTPILPPEIQRDILNCLATSNPKIPEMPDDKVDPMVEFKVGAQWPQCVRAALEQLGKESGVWLLFKELLRFFHALIEFTVHIPGSQPYYNECSNIATTIAGTMFYGNAMVLNMGKYVFVALVRDYPHIFEH